MKQNPAYSPSRQGAVFELIFAAIIWGFGFIATRWALLSTGPFWLNAFRFFLACAVSLPWILKSPRLRAQLSREQIILSFLPGVYLSGQLLFQTYGLYYTSVARSGFITVLYIVFVPLLEWIFFGKRIRWSHCFFIVIALLGAALICKVESGEWNRGDVLTLGCALVAGLQIIQLERIRSKIESPFVFNVLQSFWAGVLPTLFAFWVEPLPQWPLKSISVVGILTLAFASTLLAFLIQIRTQKILPSSLVSMLFLLESPFGALFAYFIFNEQLDLSQWIGAALILVSAFGAVKFHRETIQSQTIQS